MAAPAGAVYPAGVVDPEAALSVRAELRQAREVARQDDPRWLTVFWPLWLAVLALGFAVAETVGVVSKGKGGTLTERVKLWLGVDPPKPRRRWAAGVFLAALALFAVWFGPHISGWPFTWFWESSG